MRFVSRRLGAEEARAFRTWLYEHANTLTVAEVQSYLTARGVMGEFQGERDEVMQTVRTDVLFGLRLGVSRTPAFFVNGVRTPRPFLELAVRHELARR